MVVPSVPVGVPIQRPLAPSVASVTSVANDKSGNEMIPWAVHRSAGICLTSEENPDVSDIFTTVDKQINKVTSHDPHL